MGPVAFMISWALAVARRPHGAPPIRTSALWAFPSNMVESQLIKIHMAVDLWNYKFAWPSTMDLSCCPKEIEWIFQDSLFWTVGLLSHPIMRTNININRKQSDIFSRRAMHSVLSHGTWRGGEWRGVWMPQEVLRDCWGCCRFSHLWKREGIQIGRNHVSLPWGSLGCQG